MVPDLIKIDAESAELQVLQGLRETLFKTRPVITLEVGDYEHLLEQGGISSAQVLDHILTYDYKLYRPTVQGLISHEVNYDKFYEYDNIVAIPSELSLG